MRLTRAMVGGLVGGSPEPGPQARARVCSPGPGRQWGEGMEKPPGQPAVLREGVVSKVRSVVLGAWWQPGLPM